MEISWYQFHYLEFYLFIFNKNLQRNYVNFEIIIEKFMTV